MPCVAGRATTCWKAYSEEDPDTPLVVKDSWQYSEREEEGELLCKATERKVVNVARYYYHETVRVGTQDDSICGNARQGLDVTEVTKYKPGSTMPPPSTVVRSFSRRGRSSSAAGRKRSSSCTNASCCWFGYRYHTSSSHTHIYIAALPHRYSINSVLHFRSPLYVRHLYRLPSEPVQALP
jgi:hypothetical protein